MLKHILFTAAISTLVSCSQPPAGSPEAGKKDLEKEIRRTLNDYYADIRRHGLMAEFKYLDASPDFFWVPPGYREALSYDSVKAAITRSAPLYSSVTNTWDTLQVFPLDSSRAVYTGRLRSVMIDTAGKTSAFSMVETGVLVRRATGWKLLGGQTTLLAN